MERYRPPSFTLQELVPPSIFNRLGEKAWDLLNEDALRSLQALRDKFGPITVNNWSFGGPFKESGLREADTKTGAPKSAHKRGEAFDCKPRASRVKDIYDYVIAHGEQFPLIRRIENIKATPTWFHFDVVPHAGRGIRVFMP